VYHTLWNLSFGMTMIENKGARLTVTSGERAVRLPLRVLRSCVEKAVSLCVELEEPDSSTHEHFDAMMQQLLTATSDARDVLENESLYNHDESDSAEEAARKKYFRGLLKGQPVSLNGKLAFASREDTELDTLTQTALAEMDGVTVQSLDSYTRYEFIVPVNHPQNNLRVAVTRSEMLLEYPDQELPENVNPNGVYYSAAFGVSPK
jgi:hypothetical protein